MNWAVGRLCGATLAVVVVGACATTTTAANNLPPLQAVDRVELERYLGTWYEIASYPQKFQRGCTATTATYSAREDGKIRVVNRCRKGGLQGKVDEAKGLVRVVDRNTNAKLEVSFFRPFWGDYWVIDLDPEYRWAVVGHPSRDYLWILSREPSLDPATYDAIIGRLTERHEYDVSRLDKTLQPATP